VLVFKIVHADEWAEAERDGVYRGSEKDRADGFLHFSTAAQLRETLERHYADAPGELVIAAFDAETLGNALKWEPSRGGALFPHLYGDLPVRTTVATFPANYRVLEQSSFRTLENFLSGLASVGPIA
jgi:uncharacterized protein (DUF952 family)